MRAAPVARVAARGLIRRRAQVIVTGLAPLVSTCTSVLGSALLVDSKRSAEPAHVAAYVPALVTVSVIGLVLSLLLIARVVSAGLAAGHARITILRVIGFSPGQVIAVYAAQALVPAAIGCLAGVIIGHVLVGPLLAGAAHWFGTGVLSVPAWIDADVIVVTLGLTAIAALVPARRASRVP